MRPKHIEALAPELRNPATLAALVTVSPPAWPEPNGAEIRRITRALGIPAEVVCAVVGISRATYRRWLAHGLPSKDTDEKVRLLRVVHVVRSWLAANGLSDLEDRLRIDGAPGLTAAE